MQGVTRGHLGHAGPVFCRGLLRHSDPDAVLLAHRAAANGGADSRQPAVCRAGDRSRLAGGSPDPQRRADAP